MIFTLRCWNHDMLFKDKALQVQQIFLAEKQLTEIYDYLTCTWIQTLFVLITSHMYTQKHVCMCTVHTHTHTHTHTIMMSNLAAVISHTKIFSFVHRLSTKLAHGSTYPWYTYIYHQWIYQGHLNTLMCTHNPYSDSHADIAHTHTHT